MEIHFTHTTPSSEILINVKIAAVPSYDLNKFINKERFDNLCKKECPNYANKWSCPPFSPPFTEYSANYNNAVLILMYCTLDQFNYIKTEYMKIKASHSILKSNLDKLLRKLEILYNGLMLSSGSCKLCKACSCKNKLPCKRPDLKRYSMESLGLNISDISKTYFNHELLWYKNKTAPEYSSLISCFLTSSSIDEKELVNTIEDLIK